jgi:ribosomal protein L7/L12
VWVARSEKHARFNVIDWLMASPLGVAVIALAGFVLGRATAKSPQQRQREQKEYDAALRKIKADLKPETLTEARELVANQRAINAIKLVRDTTGCGLKEAKDIVESLDHAL